MLRWGGAGGSYTNFRPCGLVHLRLILRCRRGLCCIVYLCPAIVPMMTACRVQTRPRVDIGFSSVIGPRLVLSYVPTRAHTTELGRRAFNSPFKAIVHLTSLPLFGPRSLSPPARPVAQYGRWPTLQGHPRLATRQEHNPQLPGHCSPASLNRYVARRGEYKNTRRALCCRPSFISLSLARWTTSIRLTSKTGNPI
jgi:hypothetical protein